MLFTIVLVILLLCKLLEHNNLSISLFLSILLGGLAGDRGLPSPRGKHVVIIKEIKKTTITTCLSGGYAIRLLSDFFRSFGKTSNKV